MALVTANELKTYMDISLTNRQMDAADFVLAGLQSEMELYLRRPVEVTEFIEVHRIPSTHTGIPATSFFTNSSPTGDSFYGNTVDSTTHLEPPLTVYLLNTPVVKISKVLVIPNLVAGSKVTNKELTSNTVTLTVVGHGQSVGHTIEVDNIGAPFDGYHKIVSVPTVDTLTFTVNASDVQSVPTTEGTVRRCFDLVAEHDYVTRDYGLDVFFAYADDTVVTFYQGGVNGANIAAFKLMILRAATREMQNMHDDVVGVKDLETRNVAPLQTGFLETELMALKRYRKNRIS